VAFGLREIHIVGDVGLERFPGLHELEGRVFLEDLVQFDPILDLLGGRLERGDLGGICEDIAGVVARLAGVEMLEERDVPAFFPGGLHLLDERVRVRGELPDRFLGLAHELVPRVHHPVAEGFELGVDVVPILDRRVFLGLVGRLEVRHEVVFQGVRGVPAAGLVFVPGLLVQRQRTDDVVAQLVVVRVVHDVLVERNVRVDVRAAGRIGALVQFETDRVDLETELGAARVDEAVHRIPLIAVVVLDDLDRVACAVHMDDDARLGEAAVRVLRPVHDDAAEFLVVDVVGLPFGFGTHVDTLDEVFLAVVGFLRALVLADLLVAGEAVLAFFIVFDHGPDVVEDRRRTGRKVALRIAVGRDAHLERDRVRERAPIVQVAPAAAPVREPAVALPNSGAGAADRTLLLGRQGFAGEGARAGKDVAVPQGEEIVGADADAAVVLVEPDLVVFGVVFVDRDVVVVAHVNEELGAGREEILEFGEADVVRVDLGARAFGDLFLERLERDKELFARIRRVGDEAFGDVADDRLGRETDQGRQAAGHAVREDGHGAERADAEVAVLLLEPFHDGIHRGLSLPAAGHFRGQIRGDAVNDGLLGHVVDGQFTPENEASRESRLQGIAGLHLELETSVV